MIKDLKRLAGTVVFYFAISLCAVQVWIHGDGQVHTSILGVIIILFCFSIVLKISLIHDELRQITKKLGEKVSIFLDNTTHQDGNVENQTMSADKKTTDIKKLDNPQ